MRTRFLAFLILLLFVVTPLGVLADEPAAELLVYHSPSCSTCQIVHEQVLVPLAKAYGARLVITYIDVSQPDGLAQLEAAEERLGSGDNPLPVLVMENELISSDDVFQVEESLTALLRERIGEPRPEDQATPGVVTPLAPTPGVATVEPSQPQGPIIHLALVTQEGFCSTCSRSGQLAQQMAREFPTLVIHELSVLHDATTVEAMGLRLNLGPEQRMVDPSVYVGDDVLIGDEITEGTLRTLLNKYRGSGAPAFWMDPAPREAQPIHLAYVEKQGCSACARASIVLEALQQEFPTLFVHHLDNVQDAALVEAMGNDLGLPQAKRLVAPAIYVGRDVLTDDQITSGNLRPLLAGYATSGAPAFWEELDPDAGQSSIVQRFQSMGPAAVVLAALIDGVNPCAFATILFFVSYLAVSRRRRNELILTGLAFTLGVFLTYLLVGLGAMSLLRLVSAIRVVGTGLYAVMAIGCFVLAALSLHDYRLARGGNLKGMRLNLPEHLRERIKGRIRATSGAFAGAAFVTGLLVSLLELACTGQVYLPTISFVVGIPQMRANAIGYLVLYNVVFVTPLLVVLGLAIYGISASRFQDWFVRHAAATKLIMAVLFLLLGALLVSQVLSL
ncbi:MAG: cytochrome c biogenesis CcdA family protein [Anaerolineae bacterium]